MICKVGAFDILWYNPVMKILIPDQANLIINTLIGKGYEAYAVGGCVRDSILGRRPEDWDITTSATPQEVKHLFPRTIDTGIKHGTVAVLLGKTAFEVTTYRIDGEYEDGRHPKEVSFTKSLSEDLLRRDFTMNAMAYNDKDGLIDIFGGMEDIRKKLIRCVGTPRERLREDALRILRGIRFATQLGFVIDEESKCAMHELAPMLRQISPERIQGELVKMVTGTYLDQLITGYELGVTRQFLPEFDRIMETAQETMHHRYNVGVHTVEGMRHIAPEKVRRLTMLFHDMGKPEYKTMDEKGVAHFKKHNIGSVDIAADILRRLRFDNDTRDKVKKLVYYHDYRMPAKPINVRRAMNKIGKELFPIYLEVRRADTLAQSTYMQEEKLENIAEIEAIYHKILEEEQCITLRELALSGGDLIAAGMKPGKDIGRVLDTLLELVLEYPEMNEKELLLQEARKHVSSHK